MFYNDDMSQSRSIWWDFKTKKQLKPKKHEIMKKKTLQEHLPTNISLDFGREGHSNIV